MDLNSVIATIKSLAVIRKGGLPLSDLSRDFREMVGENLNYRSYGFNTLEALLTSVPEIKIRSSMVVVHDEKISHVADLVSRQAAKKKKSKPKYKSGGYMQRSNQFGRPQFNSGYRRPDSSQINTRPQTTQKYGSAMNYQSFRPQSQYQARPPSRPSQFQGTQSRSQSTVLPRPASRTNHHQDSCDSWSSASDDTWDCPSRKPTPAQSSRQVFAPKPSNSSTQLNKSTSNSLWSAAGKPQLQSSISHPQNSYNSSCIKPKYHFDKTCSFGAGDVRQKMKGNASSAQSQTSVKSINHSQVERKLERSVHQINAEPSQPKISGQHVASRNVHSEGFSANSRGRGRSVLDCLVDIKPVAQATDDGVVVVGPGSNTNRVSHLTDFGISVTIDNTSAEAASDWDTEEFEPSICGYQLLGDDMLLRLTEECLDCKDKIHIQGGVKRWGLCIANQTIEECHKRVKEGEPISDSVLVMLGLTDVLHGYTLSEMKVNMGALLATLRKKASSIMLLTLPVLPSLVSFPKAYETLLEYNLWLLSMKYTVFNLVIEDINPWLLNQNEEVFQRDLGETDTWTEEGCWLVMDGICSSML